MSKRAGEFITLDELLAEIGVDAARWFFAAARRPRDIDFDIELAKKQSNENPVYYVQYAHARIASILRKAAEAGLAPAPSRGRRAGRRAGGRARRAPIARFPEVVEDAAARRGDAGHHDLRDRARDDVPRLLPRRAGRRPRGTGALGRPPRTRATRPGSRSRTPSACSGSPRPSRCSRGRSARPGPGPPATLDIVAASLATEHQRTLPPSPGRTWPPLRPVDAVVAAVGERRPRPRVVSQAVRSRRPRRRPGRR